MNHIVAIVGPTAIGKTRLALKLAQTFNAEIINADSRQIYRHMHIGTAKPDADELTLVPHHMINIINPDEDFSLARYKDMTHHAIDDIQSRDKLVILVGGSGQYVWSVVEGWGIPRVPPDSEFRQSLEERAAGGDKTGLYQELQRVDPEAAEVIDSRNVRRVIRALEVYNSTGIPFSRLKKKTPPPFKVHIIGLTADRAELYRRIDLRADEMVERGLIEEVTNLLEMGYDFSLPAMTSIGYKQIGMYLNGTVNLGTAVQQIKFETHRFVRHQYTWFRLNDERIRWFDITDAGIDSDVARMVAGLVSGGSLPESNRLLKA